MTVRSIKLKLITGRRSESEQLRRGLWRTHEMVNHGIAYYMQWLVLMRQEETTQQTKEEIRLELIRKFREQQVRNHWAGQRGEDEEILILLRQLYELLVPTAIGGKGDAQMLARKFLSPLVDPNSEGGKGTAKSGRKPRWLKMKEEGNPAWEQERDKDLAKKKADPTAYVLQSLESFGLRPLFPLFTDEQKEIQWVPKQKHQFVRSWDRDMFQQAIERMLSWESWNRHVADERKKLENKKNDFYQKYFSEETEWFQALRAFEIDREKELEQDSFATVEGYLITSRQIRGWDRVYDMWNRLPETATAQQMWEAVAKVQTELRGEFGDPKVFQFLAEPKNHHIWRGKPERLLHFAAYNRLKKRLRNAKQQATFTLPDPIMHPLWIRFDARGGNNHTYELYVDDDGRLVVKFDRMLWPSENGWIERRDVQIAMAPSKQFSEQIKLKPISEGKQAVTFVDYSAKISLEGELGGAKLQFDRRYLERRRSRVADGDVGPVYLNIAINLPQPKTHVRKVLNLKVKDQKKSDWPKVIDYKPEELSQWPFRDYELNEKGIDSISKGMRVMTVDMGQRTSAAVSVFEVVDKKPADGKNRLWYPIEGTSLYAVHRRSLLLHLPGEKTTHFLVAERKRRWATHRAVREQIRLLANVLRLHKYVDPDERKGVVNDLIAAIQQSNSVSDEERTVWINELKRLQTDVALDEQAWEQALVTVHRRLEPIVGQAVHQWRKSWSQGRKGIAGLSLWNVEELEETRKLLVSWSKRPRHPKEVNRIAPEEKFALQQLTHLQHVKDDRLKQMANLIVMTALGYKYDPDSKEWIAAYPACQVILFEDLSRYRFQLDRPRRENSKLMKWSHRSIPKMVWMQGEPFGLQVGDVFAAFSSRFHAKTGAPGIRCHAVTKEDLQDHSYKQRIVVDGFLTEEQVHWLEPGDLVPDKGGELFVTLSAPYQKDDENKLSVIQADVNAAQNLQKRFWLRNSELFRVPCQLVSNGDREGYIPTTNSRAVKAQLGKGMFVKNEDVANAQVYKWENATKLRLKTTSTDADAIDELEDFEQAMEGAAELKGGHKTLFRDPSGYFFPKDSWRPQKEFWAAVQAVLTRCLRNRILKRTVEV